jgi:bisphosphoglycerate-independent phosphoglycerate mutase (AlkP superfamily)
MLNYENGHIIKEHSANPVPCSFIGESFKLPKPLPNDFSLHYLKVTGVLSDVAPTMLSIIGLEVPEQMTSRSLI